jgi:hypothetical protein
MSQSLLVAFIGFGVVMFFTPGANNIMVLSSGLTYGFRRTLPHIAGVTRGVAFVVAAVGLGLGTIFIAYPVLQTVLKYAGAAYLIYLAAMIAMSGPPKAGEEGGRGPMTLWDAAVFQWVNVKGWVMVIGTIAAYAARPLSYQHRDPDRSVPAPGRALDGHLDAVRQRAAAGAQVRTGGARLQCADRALASGLALSGLPGRMNRPRPMREQGFQ